MPPDPPPVELGAAIFALHDPHRGHERAFNRYYERDHMYAAAVLAPWTIAGQRWVATAALKARRYPDPGPFGPAVFGSYLAAYWIQAGRLAEQQAWVSAQMPLLDAAGRTFAERDVATATAYDLLGAWERDIDGVPPFLALDHRYPGLAWLVLERTGTTPVAELATWLTAEHLPATFAGTPVAQAVAFTPRPKEPWWPAAAPEVPGVGERIVVAAFVEGDIGALWDELFAGFGDVLAATGRARCLLAAPFLPTVPGTDGYADELW